MKLFKCLVAAAVVVVASSMALAQSNAQPLSYQGEIHRDGVPLDGEHFFRFRIYSNSSGGSPLQTFTGDIEVDQGLFQVDFNADPNLFGGSARWLEISVRDSGGTMHTLSPRQRMGAAPYALYAFNAPEADSGGGESIWSKWNQGINYTDGRVVIGATSGSARLDVRASGTERPFLISNGNDMLVHTYTNNSFTIGAPVPGPDDGLRVQGQTTLVDRVGIGTNNPNRALHVVSDAEHMAMILQSSAGSDGWAIGTGVQSGYLNFYRHSNVQSNNWGGTLRARIHRDSGEYLTSSDERLKSDINPLSGVLESVLELQPSSYRFREANSDGRRSLGFMAQQVESLFPDLVVRDEEYDYLGLNYAHFSVLAIQAVREQQEIIDTQADEIAQLRAELDEIRAETADRLAQLESVLLGEAEVAGVEQ